VKRVLVSACLLGEKVRYDAGDKRSTHPVLARWLAEGRVVSVCPEVSGGLGVPRPPAQRSGPLVVTEAGVDVTAQFLRGAQVALELAQRLGLEVAVLKEGSPSCGSAEVHDGTFSGRRVPGQGLTTELLRRHGVRVFSEAQFDEADAALRRS
jgi:uncharacterized protein YbbK (DUF523 family)